MTVRHGAHPRHRHHRRRGVQGLRALHRRVPAARARDAEHDVNTTGYRYPQLLAGCTGCAGVRADLPRLRVRGVPVRHADPARRAADRRDDVGDRRPTRVLMEGSEAIAEATIAAGCRFFAGYPMTPFTEVLEHIAQAACRRSAACASTPRASSRRSAWRGARPATGRARATGSTGQGLSPDAGVARRDRRSPSSRSSSFNMARGAGRLLPGDARRRPRRLPPHRARAAGRRRGRRARAARASTSPTSGATRCSSSATTSSRTRTRRSTIERVDFGDAARQGLGARRRRAAAPAAPRLVSPLGDRQAARHRRLRPRAALLARIAAKHARRSRRRRAAASRPASSTTPRWSSSRSARPARSCKYAVAGCRADGHEGRLRPADHAVAVPDRRGRGGGRAARAPSPSSSTTQGQMIDDVRLAVLGRVPGQFIGGIASTTPASASARRSTSAQHPRADRGGARLTGPHRG